jgi:signal transduction histidine kinase/DNA-binding response OmpR family regulator
MICSCLRILGLLTFILTAIFCLAEQPDTTRVAVELDSAFRLVKKKDPQALPFLKNLLASSRVLAFRRGEAEALFSLGEYHARIDASELSRTYFDSAAVIFTDIHRLDRLAQVFLTLGNMHLGKMQFPQATFQYEKAAVLNRQLGRKQNLADCAYNLGLTYSRMGNYVKALSWLLEVLKIDEELGNTANLGEDYSEIAQMYAKIGDLPKAFANLDKSIKAARASGNKQSIAASLTHYGLILKNTGKFAEAKKYLTEALDIAREGKVNWRIAVGLHNLGAMYNAQGDYAKAIAYYTESLSLKSPNQDRANYEGLAEVYYKTKRYSQAMDFAKRSLAIAEQQGALDERKKMNLLLSDIAAGQGDYQQALEYHKQYTTVKDSVLNTEKTQQIQEIQTRYETEKKEQEITALTQERKLQDTNIRQKNLIQYILAGAMLALVIFGVAFFRIFRGRQVARRLLLDEQLINKQKEAERLKELDQVKSRFYTNIAHEFRTPLTLILGPVETLAERSADPADIQQLSMISDNTSRLIKLVNQLLDLSKLEAGATTVTLVPADLIPFLKGALFAYQSAADARSIAMSFDAATESLPMKFDRDKVEKICSNLLSNAFKFTPARGNVRMAVSVDEGTVRVTVSDSGPGIPPENLPYVFNRFYQAGTAAENAAGSGIGLELTKELVSLCGGEIHARNLTTGGAEFSFTLPVIPADSVVESLEPLTVPDLGITPEAPSAVDGLPAGHPDKPLVLIIEDNTEVRSYMMTTLAGAYNVVSAHDGESGIARAMELIPDLVITDVMMPVKDGLEVCRALKEEMKTSHIPVIMLTAKADLESKIEGLESGADDYLPKPFHTKELLARVANLILSRKKLQMLFHAPNSAAPSPADTLPKKERMFLEKLQTVIGQHLAEEDYGVEQLSLDMAMSRMQLHRKLKAITDTSASLYIRSIRLAHGKRLLEEGIYTVSEVAYRVGFNSATYFSTCFSEEFGYPPSEVRTGSPRSASSIL